MLCELRGQTEMGKCAKTILAILLVINICMVVVNVISYRKYSNLVNDASVDNSSDSSNEAIIYDERIPMASSDSNIESDLNSAVTDYKTFFINVKNPPSQLRGAVGDGKHDDTEAIQKIIDYCANSGATLYFPSGTYKVNGLVISNWIGIQGESKRNTKIINYSQTEPCIKLTNGTELFTIRDIAIFGNGKGKYGEGATSSYGILLDNVSSVNINNVWLRYHGDHCITSTHTHISNINITNCDIGYSKGDGINLVGDYSAQKNAISISNSNISGCAGSGISIWGNSIWIRENSIQGNDGFGIYMAGDPVRSSVYSISIENNYFEMDSMGFIKAKVSSNPDPVRVITGLRIVGNYGSLLEKNVKQGVTSLVSFEYPQSYGEFAMLRDMMFDNPGFNSDKLSVLDANNTLLSDSTVKIPYNGAAKFANLGYATVLSPKQKTINGFFYAKGLKYDLFTGKSENIKSSTTVYFPFDTESFGSLRDFYIYCETDSTNYSVRIDRYYRDSGESANYSFRLVGSFKNLSGSQLVGKGVTSFNHIISENDVDQFFKVTINIVEPGKYFYLGNPTFTINE